MTTSGTLEYHIMNLQDDEAKIFKLELFVICG